MALILACALIWRGFQVAARVIFFTLDLALAPVLLLFPSLLALLAAILDLKVTTTPILPFGACHIITNQHQ